MALETATYISDLNASNPPGADPLSQADDHLRLIKSTVKATFPNITGVVSATQSQINLLTGTGALLLLRGYLDGCILSTAGGSATMSISAGYATDSATAYLMNLTAIAKTTSAWAVGNGTGGLDTGTIANSTWYHFYVIRRPDTGVVDVVFSTNATTPTLPTNYTQYRRIGSGLTNGSAQWTSFTQNGDEFWLNDPVQTAASGTNPGTASVSHTLTAPLGIVTTSIINASLTLTLGAGVDVIWYIRPLSATDTVPSLTTAPGAQLACALPAGSNQYASAQLHIKTNTSSQIGARLNASAAGVGAYIQSVGWIDNRGRSA
jgi:hypothetical protein